MADAALDPRARAGRPQRRGQPRPELLGLDPAERVVRGLLGATVGRASARRRS
jgi:hypothetical protein